MLVRSGDGEAALDDVPIPRWSPRTLSRGVPMSHGPTSCTPREDAVCRNIVRGANVDSCNWSKRPSGGENGIAEQEAGDAGVAAIPARPRRKTTTCSLSVKEPSTTRQAAVLLVVLLSLSTPISIVSRRSRSVERTIEMMMQIEGCPCLGARTPKATDGDDAGNKLVLCSGGGAAEVRVSPCIVTRGPRAPWELPRRGRRSPYVGQGVEQEDEAGSEAPSASPMTAGARAGGASTNLLGSRGSTAQSPRATLP